MDKLNVYIAQINTIVGDFDNNLAKIRFAYHEAKLNYSDLVIFPELAITGYPPEDLALRKSFQLECINHLHKLAEETSSGPAMLLGTLWLEGNKLYNAAALLDSGKVSKIIGKNNLPNYGVFDEKRIFDQAPIDEPIDFKGIKLGVMICEDFWIESYQQNLADKGAEIFIVLNSSPFETSKHKTRLQLASSAVNNYNFPVIYVNQIGGQDELVFDGGSFIMNSDNSLAYQAKFFEEEQDSIKLMRCESNKWKVKQTNISSIDYSKDSITYEALKLALRDYINKNNFPGVVIGMSGGIDSALTAAIAVDSLGADKVKLVMMPSKYTSNESLEDAKLCADNLKVELENIPIEPAVLTFSNMLESSFDGISKDITEENIQSRIRGLILMSLSNKFGHMVLTTGNKSEMAVGYATIYGDMCGGYNLLKDLYKTEVFDLCRWRNTISEVIPERIITKPPSAELREDQKDCDSLPPYDVLDTILYRLIELKESSDSIIHENCFPEEIVKKVARLVKISEHKRRQAPPGAKIGGLSFGKDRRYPVSHNYDF